MDIDSHPERVSNLREFANNYDWSGLEFPVSLKQIGKFEAKNNISVNVLGLEGKDIYILRNSNRSDYREINLLMISEDGINHYTTIKSLSRLRRSSNTKHKCKQYFCTNCLQGFLLEASIEFTVRITKPLESRCLERDSKLNFVTERINLKSHL